MQPESAAHTEVIGIEQAVADLDFLAFDANVSNPVLATTVGASCDMQFQVLVKAGQALFEFLNQPA